MSDPNERARYRLEESRDDACPVCHGARWVCENHPRLAWPKECDCGAGAPCPVCNNVAEPPLMDPEFVPDTDA